MPGAMAFQFVSDAAAVAAELLDLVLSRIQLRKVSVVLGMSQLQRRASEICENFGKPVQQIDTRFANRARERW